MVKDYGFFQTLLFSTMKHFQRISIHVAVFLGLLAGALVLYKNLGHVGRDFYIVHENGETVPASRDQFGIEKQEAAFVTHFRKGIFPEAVSVETESVEQLKEHIKMNCWKPMLVMVTDSTSGLISHRIARDSSRISCYESMEACPSFIRRSRSATIWPISCSAGKATARITRIDF